MREVIKNEIKSIPSKEIMKDIGSRWAHLDSESKAPYEALAAQDQIRFEREMAKHRSQTDESKSITSLTPQPKKNKNYNIENDESKIITSDSPQKSESKSQDNLDGKYLNYFKFINALLSIFFNLSNNGELICSLI